MTNGDMLRSMSDEQLAEFIANEIVAVGSAVIFGAEYEKMRLYSDYLKWLRKEAEQ